MHSKKVVNIYIVYELGASSSNNSYPTLKNCLFGAVTLTKNADVDKYGNSGYGIGFDRTGSFSFSGGGFGQNVSIFGVDMSLLHTLIIIRHISLRNRTNTRIRTYTDCSKIYSISFVVTNVKFCLSLHYNGANSYLFVNGTEIYKFKAKDSEIVATPLCS